MARAFWKGLKTIEIGIMIAVIIMLVSLIYFRKNAFMCRCMESEAKFALEQIYAAQKLYHEEKDSFASMDVLLDKEKRVFLPQKYYFFKDAKEPLKDHFLVQAVGKPGTLVDGQLWEIDENKTIKTISRLCDNNETR